MTEKVVDEYRVTLEDVVEASPLEYFFHERVIETDSHHQRRVINVEQPNEEQAYFKVTIEYRYGGAD